MQIIGALVGLIYRSLFMSGETGLRTVPSVLKTIIIILSALIYIPFYNEPYMPVLILSIIGLLGFNRWWAGASLALSSIPGIWYGLTAYLFGFLGFATHISPIDAAMIYFRTTYISFLVLFAGSIISPVQLSNFLIKIGLSDKAIMPVILWRTMPAGLHDMMESLAIGALKGEKAWKRLGPATASMIEYSRFVWENNYYRLESPLKTLLPYRSEKKYVVLVLASIFFEASILVLYVLGII